METATSDSCCTSTGAPATFAILPQVMDGSEAQCAFVSYGSPANRVQSSAMPVDYPCRRQRSKSATGLHKPVSTSVVDDAVKSSPDTTFALTIR